MQRLVLAMAAVAVLAVAVLSLSGMLRPTPEAVDVTMPVTLTERQAAGQAVFVQHCASCHGADAGGSENGPPLIHPIYEPGHHGDGAILAAIENGSRAHHWKFGDMPPQPAVGPDAARAIVDWLRRVQSENGIE